MTDKNNEFLGAKVPQEWINQFEKLAQQSGRSVTELVRDALAQYIGIDASSSKVVSQLEQVQIELKLLRQKIAEMELYKTQIRELSVRLAAVEQSRGKERSQFLSPNSLSFSQSSLIKSETEEDEDYEDEPDEVLTDFLP
ncbi:ribbon-helix-helix protein, CopG family [Gloeothece verrucosa]|uniref:Ribbon-helix-helix protein CopG domain-containing protein n=1 Tax=Gloeothece verrucosa (strain PCC 7822) TaxID=497965 RepID=E0U6L0_GLOV7|nr:ribbon-helix-helix protein, CopG family [Gloeothece verrucosa]ADN14769.1 hypothetical protein Cyan7822_2808 [Gloeothece verrucosa PCC 7822]